MKGMEREKLVQLCTEICGPLAREEYEYVCRDVLKLDTEGREMAEWSTMQRHKITELISYYDSTAELRTLCATLMHYRAEQGRRGEWDSKDRRIGTARYCLVKDSRADFMQAYAQCQRYMGSYEWKPESFWSKLLGPEWEGYERVPQGAPRNKLLLLLWQRYALYELPHLNYDELHQAAPDLAIAYHLLRADNGMASIPPKQHPVEVRGLVQVYWAMRTGQWEQAFDGIEAYLTEQREAHPNTDAPGNGIFALLGMILGIQIGIARTAVKRWSRRATTLLSGGLPDTDKERLCEIRDFFSMLLAWDEVRNSHVPIKKLPEVSTPLPLVALAIGSPDMPAAELPIDRMLEAVEAVEARGICLLSVYAAASLLQDSRLTRRQRAPLYALLEKHSGFAPLFSMPVKEPPPEDKTKKFVDLLNGEDEDWEEENLYWDLHLTEHMMLEAIVPRSVTKRPQYTGTEITPMQALDCGLPAGVEDVAMVGLLALLKERKEGVPTPLVAEVLAAHPRLRLVEGAYRRPVSLEKTNPRIRVEVRNSRLYFELDAEQFLCFGRPGKSVLTLPWYPPHLERIVRRLAEAPVGIALRRTDMLREAIMILERDFELDGDMPEELRSYAESACELLLRLTRDSRGCDVELLVRHREGTLPLSVPGQGDEILALEGGETAKRRTRQCVRRDMQREIRAAEQLVACNRALQESPRGENGYTWRVTDEKLLLHLIHDSTAAAVPIQWGKARRVLHIMESGKGMNLNLTLLRTTENWLEIGASLQVDETRVLELTAILHAFRRRHDCFIPLENDTYLAASPELMDRLLRLSETVRTEGAANVVPLSAVPALAGGWQAEELPDFLRERVDKLRECDSAPVPTALKASLREYQVQGYRWMLARVRAGLGACLADDMGLGKTVQLLALLVECAAQGPSLVVAPLSLCSNWEAEAARFAPGLRVLVYNAGLREQQPALRAGDLMVASYGQLMSASHYFSEIEWNIVALDEAQSIKNPDSRRAMVVCSLKAHARLCLTGTPVENIPLDMWSIMHFLNPPLLGSRREFGINYRNSADSLRRMVGPLVLRRTKKEVLPQLPPIMEVEVGVELSAEERALYETIRRDAVARVQSGGDTVTLLAELTRLRRLCCHGKLALESFVGKSSKLETLLELVTSLREGGHSVLVFSQFTDVLDLTQAELEAHGFSLLRLDGSTAESDRRARVEAFQRGEAPIFLISLKAGGSGLNLTAADYVILMDPWWNPAVEAQAAGRSHRLGQNNPVTVCRLIARDTVEERVMQMHEAKRELADDLLRGTGIRLELLRSVILNS